MNPKASVNPPTIIKAEGSAATHNPTIQELYDCLSPLVHESWDKEATGFESFEDYLAFAELAVRAAVHSRLWDGQNVHTATHEI